MRMSVNNLIQRWRKGKEVGDDLCDVQRCCWFFTSEALPEKDDANQNGHVMVLWFGEKGADAITHEFWDCVDCDRHAYWARIGDVVLMPPEDV